MSQIDDAMDEPEPFRVGRTLWQRCRSTDVGRDDAERFLDLAALADGLLDDDDEHDRVAALVASDRVAMSDVAAGRAISAGGIAMPGGLEQIIQHAIAIVDETARDGLIPVASPPRARSVLQGVAQWGGLAAAIAFASWLGFSMGSDASLTLVAPGQPTQASDEYLLPDLLDPSTGFLRDLGEGRRT